MQIIYTVLKTKLFDFTNHCRDLLLSRSRIILYTITDDGLKVSCGNKMVE